MMAKLTQRKSGRVFILDDDGNWQCELPGLADILNLLHPGMAHPAMPIPGFDAMAVAKLLDADVEFPETKERDHPPDMIF